MKRYILIVAALLLPGTAFAQTPPVAGGGCTPGPHTFCVLNTADSGTGSLRQAIIDSNTAGGANTIGFAIPTNPVTPTPQTITLSAPLPAINPNNPGGIVTSLIVDGYSQPGSVLNTNAPDQGGLNTKLMIEIVGTGNGNGFIYGCCANPFITLVFQGLNLHGFSSPFNGQTATLTPMAQWNIYGCFIGTTIDGAAAPAQAAQNGSGISLYYDDAQIGGTQAWQRNLISGNAFDGFDGGSPNSTVIIEGNLIGTDFTGTLAVPNRGSGLNVSGNLPGMRIGCTGTGCAQAAHASRNVISGNGNDGIRIFDLYHLGTGGLQIKGNYIGTDRTGTQPLPNGDANCISTYCGGIQTLNGSTGAASIVGGFAAGEANLIAYNNGPGIWNNDLSSTPGIGASFDNQGNAIHNNGPADILFSHLWIPNDPGDADTGVNNQQNYPVIQSAHVSSGQLIVTYSVDSTTGNSTYPLRIDFYVDIDEGSGEFLFSDTYTSANAQQMRTVTLPLPVDAQMPVGFVVTASTADHYTSEFSPSYVFDRIFADGFEPPR